MKTQHLVTLTAVFRIAAAAALAAQAGGQSDRADSTTRMITVTGCLERDTPSASTTTATTTTTTTTAGTTGSERFVLIKGAAGPAGDPTFHADKRHGPWYLIVGDGAKLRRNAKQLVEVKGTLDTAGSVVGTSASATDGPSGTIHMTSIKALDDTCGE